MNKKAFFTRIIGVFFSLIIISGIFFPEVPVLADTAVTSEKSNTTVTVPKAALKKVALTDSGYLKVSWKSIPGAKFVLYRKTNTDTKYVKVVTTTKTSYTDKKLGDCINVSYKVRAYIVDSNGKKVYGAYSSVKKYAFEEKKVANNDGPWDDGLLKGMEFLKKDDLKPQTSIIDEDDFDSNWNLKKNNTIPLYENVGSNIYGTYEATLEIMGSSGDDEWDRDYFSFHYNVSDKQTFIDDKNDVLVSMISYYGKRCYAFYIPKRILRDEALDSLMQDELIHFLAAKDYGTYRVFAQEMIDSQATSWTKLNGGDNVNYMWMLDNDGDIYINELAGAFLLVSVD